MPDTVSEGGGVLDSPEIELSPEGPSTGGSSPLDSSSPRPGSSPLQPLSPMPRPFSPTSNPPSRLTCPLCPATPSTSISSPRPSSNGRKRKTAEDPLDTDVMQQVDDCSRSYINSSSVQQRLSTTSWYQGWCLFLQINVSCLSHSKNGVLFSPLIHTLGSFTVFGVTAV